MYDLLLLLTPAVLAGCVAIGVTVAIERWGGIRGGLLGTLPTTIVPATAGVWVASPDPTTFAAAMGGVPVGMLIDAIFLYLWRVVPPRLPPGPVAARLLAMVGISVGIWGAVAAGAVAAVATFVPAGSARLGIGAAALGINVLVGIAACWVQVPAPAGRRPVAWPMLVARGGLAAMAIGVATALAWTGSGLLAGIAAAFPAIFLTTMVGLWVSQDAAVPSGAVGPMMLGASAVGAFALLAAVLFPLLGAGLGTVVAWIIAAGGVTVPSAAWLARR